MSERISKQGTRTYIRPGEFLLEKSSRGGSRILPPLVASLKDKILDRNQKFPFTLSLFQSVCVVTMASDSRDRERETERCELRFSSGGDGFMATRKMIFHVCAPGAIILMNRLSLTHTHHRMQIPLASQEPTMTMKLMDHSWILIQSIYLCLCMRPRSNYEFWSSRCDQDNIEFSVSPSTLPFSILGHWSIARRRAV